MKRPIVERGMLLTAAALFGLMLWGRQGPLSWSQSALYVPAGLLVLAVANTLLRSKVLAWGIFTLALVVLMIIGGTWVVLDRARAGFPSRDFVRSVALYGVLSSIGLMQLRVPAPPKGASPP